MTMNFPSKRKRGKGGEGQESLVRNVVPNALKNILGGSPLEKGIRRKVAYTGRPKRSSYCHNKKKPIKIPKKLFIPPKESGKNF